MGSSRPNNLVAILREMTTSPCWCSTVLRSPEMISKSNTEKKFSPTMNNSSACNAILVLNEKMNPRDQTLTTLLLIKTLTLSLPDGCGEPAKSCSELIGHHFKTFLGSPAPACPARQGFTQITQIILVIL